jgi:hypothetical protein
MNRSLTTHATNDIVMFGGQTATAVLGDTWTLRGSTWTLLHPAHSPSPRTVAAMVYGYCRTRAESGQEGEARHG